MPRTPLNREILLPRLAAHVLQHGISGLSLRPLAIAAGTSDRMLLYHFGTKQRLVADLLEYIAAGFAGALDMVLPPGRAQSRATCLQSVAAATRAPAFATYLVLWWQIVAGAAQGEPTWRAAAVAIVDRMLGWMEQHLPADDPDPASAARHILTLLEGAQMLDAVGRSDIADAALAAALAGSPRAL